MTIGLLVVYGKSLLKAFKLIAKKLVKEWLYADYVLLKSIPIEVILYYPLS